MTDNEIIQTLECLFGCVDCRKCPYSSRYEFPLCQQQVAKDTLDLINRKQAEIIRLQSMNQAKLDTIHDLQVEIERLQKHSKELFENWKILDNRTKERYAELYEEAKKVLKSEAYKEFADKMKKYIDVGHLRPPTEICFSELDVVKMIDKTAEEMEGDTECWIMK